jgi:hypothetical protein
MLRSVWVFAAGLGVGVVVTASTSLVGQSRGVPVSQASVVQLRLYTIDKGRLDDFAAAWRAGVYPLRSSLGYRIPFAAKIPSTNQFVWLATYDGSESWERKEAAYYASAARAGLSPDPAQWIARPEQWMVTPVVGLSASAP